MMRFRRDPDPTNMLAVLRPPRLVSRGHSGPLFALKRCQEPKNENPLALTDMVSTSLELEQVHQATSLAHLVSDDAFDGFINPDLTIDYHVSLRYYLSDWADMVEARPATEWLGRLKELVRYSGLCRVNHYSKLVPSMPPGVEPGLNPKHVIAGVVGPLSKPDFTEADRASSVSLLRDIAKATMPTHATVFLLQADVQSDTSFGSRTYPEETLLGAASGFSGSDGIKIVGLTVAKAEDQTTWLVGLVETSTLPANPPRSFSIRPRGEGILSDDGVVTDYRITGFDLIDSATDRWSPWWEPVRME